MISYLGYKFMHLTGIFLILISLGGLLILRGTAEETRRVWRKHLSILNGVGLLIAFVAGFGLMARLNLDWPWPGWIYLKLLVWLYFGAVIALINRLEAPGKALLWLSIVAAALGAYLANFKPF